MHLNAKYRVRAILIAIPFKINARFIHNIFFLIVDLDSQIQPSESICKSDPKEYVQEREVESSLIYDLHPGDMLLPCRTVLTAPESNGFIVRLHKSKVKKVHGTTHKSSGEGRIRNSTSCPLSIVSKFFLNKLQLTNFYT